MTIFRKHFFVTFMMNLIAFAAAGQAVGSDQAQESGRSKVTILVEGMMKSRGGAT